MEDVMPVYMQEAFFGTNTLTNCQDADFGSDELALKLEQEKKSTNKDLHRINLDENMLKLAQQKQRGHLELGIEGTVFKKFNSYS